MPVSAVTAVTVVAATVAPVGTAPVGIVLGATPLLPGGPLTSKPMWSNASGCSDTSVFFALGAAVAQLSEMNGVVMSPTNGVGYAAYTGGETVNLGAVNSSAFGTPGFRP